MDQYHLWFNLKPGVGDVELCDHVNRYLGHLKEQGKIVGYRLSRRKLALGPSHLGEFHVVIETADLAQLDTAFSEVATRSGEVESLHAAVNQKVTDLTAALYRDFPDAVRLRGGERF
jgi:hypothetical protein